jgi:hypothetical protein
VDVKDTTPPDETSHYDIPEVIDLDSNESDSPEQHDRYGETLFEHAGQLNKMPAGQRKQESMSPSAHNINSSSTADSNECTKQVLAAVENLSVQVEMLRRSMVLMEERLTRVEETTKHTVSSKRQ